LHASRRALAAGCGVTLVVWPLCGVWQREGEFGILLKDFALLVLTGATHIGSAISSRINHIVR